MGNYTVYCHKNKINGKRYIGITSLPPKNRWNNGNGYTGTIFGLAIEEYGWENFSHETILSGLTKKQAKEKETQLINFYKTVDSDYGYNVSRGTGGNGGHKSFEKYLKDNESNKILSRLLKECAALKIENEILRRNPNERREKGA